MVSLGVAGRCTLVEAVPQCSAVGELAWVNRLSMVPFALPMQTGPL